MLQLDTLTSSWCRGSLANDKILADIRESAICVAMDCSYLILFFLLSVFLIDLRAKIVSAISVANQYSLKELFAPKIKFF